MQLIKGEGALTLTTPDELTSYAQDAGLTVDKCVRRTNPDITFINRDEFQSWVQSILQPYGVRKIFGDREVEFVGDVVDAYCKDYNIPTDGTVSYQSPVEVYFIAHQLV
jgi:hypothetical protein